MTDMYIIVPGLISLHRYGDKPKMSAISNTRKLAKLSWQNGKEFVQTPAYYEGRLQLFSVTKL